MAADQYTISDLGVGGPTGINNNGDVVGVSGFGAYGTRACIFRGTNVIDLGVLGGALGSTYSQATAINDNGDVVGYSTVTNNVIHAFLYTAGVMKDLGTLDGGSNLESAAISINALGEIVGYSYTSTGAIRPFLYTNGIMTDLGTLGGSKANANWINGKGDIVGTSENIAGIDRAFLYSGGVMTDLGTLGGPGSGAVSINDKGQVAGISDMSDGSLHAFLYSAGSMTDIGALAPDSSYAHPYALNNQGQVVGSMLTTNSNDPRHAFLFANGQLFDLNKLVTLRPGWTLATAYAINDHGWIACDTFNLFNRSHLYLLKPVVHPPVLAVSLSTDLVLSWTADGYVLETTDNLGSSAAWTPITNAVVNSGGTNYFTNSISKGVGFFRLRK